MLGRLLPFGDSPVAVLSLRGAITSPTGSNSQIMSRGGLNMVTLDKSFAKLRETRRTPPAICLDINCPGGSPVQSQLIADRILEIKADLSERAKADVPVLAFCEDVAASGGYWLACAADTIYVQPATLIGSIGVIFASFGFEDVLKQYSVHRRMTTSGPDKALGDPFSPVSDSHARRLRALSESVFDEFKSWCELRRGDRLCADRQLLYSGAVWTGREALPMGLADQVGERQVVCRQRFGKDVKFVAYGPRSGFLSSMGMDTLSRFAFM